MKKTERKRQRGTLSLVLGAALLLGAFFLTGYNLYDDSRAGAASDAVVRELTLELTEDGLRPAGELLTEEDVVVFDNRSLPVKTIDGRDYVGVLQFPRFSLELPVQTPYVYESLRVSPCLYAGDPYHNDMVICAHNYDSHFGRLKDMELGDELLFIAMDGEVFRYELSAQDILTRYSTEEMLNADTWDLTLFTCTLGGEQRVTARFVRVQETPVAGEKNS